MDTLNMVAESLDSGLPDGPTEWINAVLVLLFGMYQLFAKVKARKEAKRLTDR